MVLMTHERCALKKKTLSVGVDRWNMCLAAGTCTDALHLSVVFWTFLHGYHGSFATHDHSGPRMVYTWDNAERFNAHSIRSQNLWSSSVNIQLFFKDYHHHPLGYSNTIQGGPLVVSCFTTAMNYWYYLPYFIDFTQLFASSWQGGRLTLIYVSTPNLGFESLFVYSFQVAQHQRYSGHSRFYGSRTRVISNAI
jgi:hypothetical protein